MDNIRLHKEKIKDIAYIAVSVLVVIVLLVGIFITKDEILPFSEYKDSFWVAMPYTITIFLVVKMIFIITIGRIRQLLVSFVAISLSSFLAFQCAFISISLSKAFPLGGAITLLDRISMGVLWPSGMVWMNYGVRWPLPDAYPIVFVVLATAFMTAFEYFWLRKRTEKKKALFFTILITSFALCTVLSIFMQIKY